MVCLDLRGERKKDESAMNINCTVLCTPGPWKGYAHEEMSADEAF